MVLVASSFLGGQLAATLALAETGMAPMLAAIGLAVLARASTPLLAATTRGLAVALVAAWLCPSLEPRDEECWRPPADAVVKRWIVGTIVAPVVPAEPLRLTAVAALDGAEGGNVCGRVRLSLRSTPEADLRPGDRIRAHASLRRPRDFANPSAFAYAASLARQGVFVVGSAARLASVDPGGASLARSLDRVRARVRAAIGQGAAEPGASLLRAVVLGESAVVEDDLREALAASGLAHLLAVSGLHVGAVWGAVVVVLRFLLGRSERLMLALDVPLTAAALATIPALGYAALAGGTLPTERAAAFVLLGVAATAAGRETRPERLLAIAAIALSLAHPGAVRSISFQLSFAAVGGLLVAFRLPSLLPESTPPALSWLETALRIAAAATLATSPLAAFHFNRVAPIGLVANPLLVPLLGVPGTLIGLAGGALTIVWEAGGGVLLGIAARLLEILVAAAEMLAAIPGASFRVPTPSVLEIALVYGAMATWAIEGRRRRLTALLLLAAMLADVGLWTQVRSGAGELRIRFLDVGQGDAAIIELPDGRVVVIDGGGLPSEFDVGERVVAPALWARKITRVDVLVASHGDRDHQGGLGFLARGLAPRELWIPDVAAEAERLAGLVNEARRSGAHVRRLRRGDRIADPSGVVFECLHPPAGFGGSSNDGSLVLRLRHHGRVVVFTGDVERAAEAEIHAQLDEAGVDLWKVAHHGSATSSDARLLARARPRFSIVSVGAANPFGMPRLDVLRRHRRAGARVLRTDQDGSIVVILGRERTRIGTTDAVVRLGCSAMGAMC